ncbi:MAG TPA: hypothetical protein VFQ65_21830 [Kofleriaceae bacterium]|nr:hypothetical protein [Kofleriaceae bacterium]
MRARIVATIATLALAFASACGDDGNNTGPKDAAVIDAPPMGGPDASCFTNPTTYNEIINACTTAQKIYKHTNLPLLGSGGSLPPLP